MNFKIEEWNERTSRWPEFIACLKDVAPDQLSVVLGEQYRAYRSYLFVALCSDEVVGLLRFAAQPLGPQGKWPAPRIGDAALCEAKVHAFAVREEARGQGIGTALQKRAVLRARELGCSMAAHPIMRAEP